MVEVSGWGYGVVITLVIVGIRMLMMIIIFRIIVVHWSVRSFLA